jgi:hypothetical protein
MNPKHVKSGVKIRVKRTSINRKFGVSCSNIWEANNRKLWPGEIGTIVEYQGNGWRGLKAEFEQGRTIQVGTLYEDSENWEIEVDKLEDFAIIKA